MCTVNSEVSLVRRPMFHMSKVVADECNLRYAEEDVPADVTVVPLRCEELSACAQLPFTMVQCCVYETVTSLFRAISKRQDTDFIFKAIGILSIRNREVTMRFFDDFLLNVDGSEKVLEALLSTPESRHLVASSRESHDFRVGPGGVFVLPQFDFMLPPKKEALVPSVEPLNDAEDREVEEEEKEEKEEEEDDKQIEPDVSENPSTERLLSRGRHSRSPSAVSGLKKGKRQKGKGKRSPGSFLPRIQESFLVAEKDVKHKQTPHVRPQTTLPDLRSKMRTSRPHQETSLQAGWSHETLTEIWPPSPLPPTGKEESTAPFLHKAMVKRKLEGLQGLPKLHVPTNLSLGNLSSSSCRRCEEFQLLSSGAGQLSMRANYILQLLETYHMRREEWSRRVELNLQRNYEKDRLFW
ncbi:coiled-coil domain-containing protein 81-like [Chroicocephalus ridibundus]|uniref:coiled-coil domain-containing protein 81-like n=1 Tax=Chroicocephalus ridibundus TaxID=1192867 RepID=UPI002FDD6BFB